MLIVQRIITAWTKASRGGADAGRRNATPESLLLPQVRDANVKCLYHDNRFLERNRFRHDADLAESTLQQQLRIEPLVLSIAADTITARFVWSWHHCGAPERKSQDLFRLTLGEWGRFIVNGRFGAESTAGREWGYHKTVFNIALTPEFIPTLFVDSVPHSQVSLLAALK